MRQLKIVQSITPRGTKSLDKYLQEIGKVDLITALDEVELAQKIKMGDAQALEKLVKANLRFVVSVAKQYQNQGLSIDDVINEGNLGLIKAAQRFDETRGFKFISYAVWRIRQSIMQAIAENSRMVRLPTNKVGQLNRVNKEIIRLEQVFDREPTSDELADILELSEGLIEEIRGLGGRTLSLDKPVNNDSNEGTHLDMMGTEENESTDYGLHLQSFKKEIARALETLTPRERDVVKLYFGIDQGHGYTLEEIGEKFDLTRERVRQIKEKAIRRLKHTTKSKLLKQYLGQ